MISQPRFGGLAVTAAEYDSGDVHAFSTEYLGMNAIVHMDGVSFLSI
jgi:hypothetical protein